MNLGFDWTVTKDDATSWVVSIGNHRAQGPMTVDVTPRRAQAFRPTPGQTVSYTTSSGQSGTLVAGPHGLVTVPALQIALGAKTVLTLTR